MMDQLPGTTAAEELKRTSRIIEMVRMIANAPERYNRKALADRFEISERMIGKDLEVIRHGLKLPLLHSKQGYSFENTPHLPLLQYSFSEALALLSAVQAALQMAEIGSPDLAAAIARLEALFPAEFVPLLRQVSRPAPATAHGQHRQQMFILLNRALLGQNKVDMHYETASRGGDITERVVRPYAIMPYVRSWQLIAYCETRSAILMFKLDRIQEARILPERYVIPESFTVDGYMGNTWGALRSEHAKVDDVLLHFDAEAGRWVTEEAWHATQEVDHLEDGSVLFRVRIVVTPEFVKWVLRYGSQVKVIEPSHLREAVATEHKKAALLYR
ncbi:MAG: WYL domain-containing protein [Anaerolineales bacterium]|nr:WYL domain-containing protein [Anaerolineales bacterium]